MEFKLKFYRNSYNSIMYYNSEIWHIPTLKPTLKQKILSVSAKALRVCTSYVDYGQSFVNVHRMCNRASLNSIMSYKLALCLHKIYNQDFNSIEFTNLNFNQILKRRQTVFKTLKTNFIRWVWTHSQTDWLITKIKFIGLATLLEGAGCKKFKVNLKNILLIYLLVLTCFKRVLNKL